jgi:hypothetical protein
MARSKRQAQITMSEADIRRKIAALQARNRRCVAEIERLEDSLPELLQTDNMVLRTVFLPRSLDEWLKVEARRRGISKGQLIRDCLTAAIPQLRALAG